MKYLYNARRRSMTLEDMIQEDEEIIKKYKEGIEESKKLLNFIKPYKGALFNDFNKLKNEIESFMRFAKGRVDDALEELRDLRS